MPGIHRVRDGVYLCVSSIVATPRREVNDRSSWIQTFPHDPSVDAHSNRIIVGQWLTPFHKTSDGTFATSLYFAESEQIRMV